MTENEARFILSSRRPDGADDRTPPFAEALQVAEANPQLGRWHERERAFDARVVTALSQVTPPAGLRDAILAGGRMSRPAPWWRTWGALAACVAVLLAGASIVASRISGVSPSDVLLAAAFSDLSDPEHSPVAGSALEAMFSQSSVRVSAGLPGTFQEQLDAGCRTVLVAGIPVIEVCFVRPEVKTGEFHLYIARAADFSGVDAPSRPRFTRRDGHDAVTWSDGRHLYVLVTDAGRAALRAVL